MNVNKQINETNERRAYGNNNSTIGNEITKTVCVGWCGDFNVQIRRTKGITMIYKINSNVRTQLIIME